MTRGDFKVISTAVNSSDTRAHGGDWLETEWKGDNTGYVFLILPVDDASTSDIATARPWTISSHTDVVRLKTQVNSVPESAHLPV